MDYLQNLVNYGAMGVCLGYFIWKDNATMKEFRNTLTDLREVLTIIKTDIEQKK